MSVAAAPTSTPIPFDHASPRWQHALAKAERIAAESPFVFGDGSEYLVLGTNDNHTVKVNALGGTYLCDCTASAYGQPCVHIAGVVLKMRSRVAAIVAPAPKPRKIYNCDICGRRDVSPLHSVYGCED